MTPTDDSGVDAPLMYFVVVYQIDLLLIDP